MRSAWDLLRRSPLRRNAHGGRKTLSRGSPRVGKAPRIAVECDSASSVVLAVEAGRGIALVSTILKRVAGKRLLYRRLTGTTEAQSVGIGRATKGDVTPACEKILRNLAENFR